MRYSATVDSSAALAGNTTFANLAAGASQGLILRRIIVGVRAGASTPTSQQMTLAVYRATARGTVTTTVTPVKLDNDRVASQITGLDTVWSVAPTLAATPMFTVSFNTQSGADLPFEGLEEVRVGAGSANGLAFYNVTNALPASHLYTLTVEWEE